LIAFVDQDDLWHPTYLEVQCKSFVGHPTACAFFTWHVNFAGYGDYEWDPSLPEIPGCVEVINPLEFLARYNKTTGHFASMSYCCVPKRVLTTIGKEPFCLSGVDDSYLCTLLPLCGGQVVYNSAALVAYRVTNSAQSVDRLKFASKKRQYGKLLMAAGKAPEAREQFWQSMVKSLMPSSVAKSIALLLSSYMPSPLQPKWPPLYRRWKEPD
jgi:hypothetical protein